MLPVRRAVGFEFHINHLLAKNFLPRHTLLSMDFFNDDEWPRREGLTPVMRRMGQMVHGEIPVPHGPLPPHLHSLWERLRTTERRGLKLVVDNS
jgi:hypothetical protein